MRYFNIDAYERLGEILGKKAKANKAADKEITHFENAMKTFVGYCSSVSRTTVTLDIADLRYADDPETGELIHRLVRMSIDIEKKLVAAMAALINNLAETNGVDDVYTGDYEDMDALSEFCLEVSKGIFEARRR